ncbi:hypothetical protein CDL15_Pgr019344 [Punica granatum]|uniref:Uncharacterized protein n=1 Tax=Punica granatum TaxID=22663 RepID=A0A218X678_PUNGR|nr:hypothetical protein CDL15_Pgr019344 [Punica granatum]
MILVRCSLVGIIVPSNIFGDFTVRLRRSCLSGFHVNELGRRAHRGPQPHSVAREQKSRPSEGRQLRLRGLGCRLLYNTTVPEASQSRIAGCLYGGGWLVFRPTQPQSSTSTIVLPDLKLFSVSRAQAQPVAVMANGSAVIAVAKSGRDRRR